MQNLTTILLLTTLTTLIKSAPYPATSSLPANMQSKRVDLYSTSTTNVVGATFLTNYDNSLVIPVSGSYNPIGFVIMYGYADQFMRS